MVVWVAGAHGRLGSRVVALLRHRGHVVRAVVRTEGQAEALRELGAEVRVADLRGDIEWTFGGCDAAVFAAGARHRADLAAIDAGGAVKAAEAAAHAELERFVLCSAVGADAPQRRDGGVRDFLTAKYDAERRIAQLDLRWTILRFGRLTEDAGTGRIATATVAGRPATLSRDDAALAVVEALERDHLARSVVPVVAGDRPVGSAFDSIEPHELPSVPVDPGSLAAGQSDHPRVAANMLAADAMPFDSDVDWQGDGRLPPEQVGNEDPSPGVP
jgi:uncharacterized protein YbjT (DUF2867 family)